MPIKFSKEISTKPRNTKSHPIVIQHKGGVLAAGGEAADDISESRLGELSENQIIPGSAAGHDDLRSHLTRALQSSPSSALAPPSSPVRMYTPPLHCLPLSDG